MPKTECFFCPIPIRKECEEMKQAYEETVCSLLKEIQIEIVVEEPVLSITEE